MLMIVLLYLLFGVNLFQIIIQDGFQCYKTSRFWMIVVPLGILVWATVFS